jgi:Uma2 family endonuclease
MSAAWPGGVGPACHTGPMTAPPLERPRLLTVAEFAVLPEATAGRYELREGKVVMPLSPVPGHQLCLQELLHQLRGQLPPRLCTVPEVDIDLGSVPPERPGFVRIPDLVVVTRAGVERRRREGGLLRASEVVLAVEIVSDGSQRTDRTITHGEYADAGIPHYWIVDIDDRPALTVCHQAGEFGYADAPPATGVFTTEQPFPVRLDLDALG